MGFERSKCQDVIDGALNQNIICLSVVGGVGPTRLIYLDFHRAAAAFCAINFRFRADRLAARANPPLDAPSFDSATAAGFRESGGSADLSRGLPSIFAPMRSSTTDLASRFGSRGRFGVLAREGMV
jgi:hypothetical protein